MTVPDRTEAAALLLSLEPPPWFLRHSRAVAEIAGWLALAAVRAGRPVDRRLVEAAALLHDVDKLPAVGMDEVAVGLPHGEGSAAWLAGRGFPELGPAVGTHPVVRLADGSWWATKGTAAPLEVRIVAYADKRAGQRLERMDERFTSWRRRYPPDSRTDGADGWDEARIGLIRTRADELERGVCAAAGIAPGAVRRLAWTGPALAAVRSRGTR